jgi:lipid II:glycine glycyltransferase (peptidoglycan interpeptide bridge formation enzyme)
LLTGHRGVSLPFTDVCEPINSETLQFQDIFDYISEYGRRKGWKSIELRCGKQLFSHSPVSTKYFGHTLDLTLSEDHIFKKFRKGVKSAIHKAIADGVEVSISDSFESVKEFYKLNCITRKRHGLPSQPFQFFRKVYDHVISKKLGFVALASFQNVVIAGAVYFNFGEKVVYKYAASDKKWQLLRANNLIMWEAIKWCHKNGFSTLCLGRTDVQNDGLRSFKTGWGTQENVINYYRYNLRKDAFIIENGQVSQASNKILSRMPISILNFIGMVLYRHMG